jgi:hypothetical protein
MLGQSYCNLGTVNSSSGFGSSSDEWANRSASLCSDSSDSASGAETEFSIVSGDSVFESTSSVTTTSISSLPTSSFLASTLSVLFRTP